MHKRVNTKAYTSTAARFILALAVLLCAFVSVSNAQETGSRSSRSLTSEDLLNRPARSTGYSIAPAVEASHVSSRAVISPASSSYYRDPAGAFTLNFPNNGWRVNARGGSAGRAYNQRSFRRMDAEGFASATANVYVLSDGNNSNLTGMSVDEQHRLAGSLTKRFLSSNASLVSVTIDSRTGLRIIADQMISRRVAVRAVIQVFERQGRLYVIVCCASPETFDASQYEFDAISNSLASSVMRS